MIIMALNIFARSSLKLAVNVVKNRAFPKLFSLLLPPAKALNRYAALAVAFFTLPFCGHADTCAAPPAGLVAWWRGETNALDAIGAHNGAIVNNVGFAPGKVGSAFSFQHIAGQRIDIPNNASLDITGPITVEAWIKLNDIAGQRPIVEKYGTTGGFGLRVQDRKLQFFTTDNCCTADIVSGATLLASNAWYHVAGEWTGSQHQVYVNGVLDGALTTARNPKAGAPYLRIGARGDDYLEVFNGLIDEPSIYNRALSQVELAAIYNSGAAGKCQPSGPAPVPAGVRLLPTTQDARADGAHFTICAMADSGAAPLVYNWTLVSGQALAFTPQGACLDLRIDPSSAEPLFVSVTVTNSYGSTGPVVSPPLLPCNNCPVAQTFSKSVIAFADDFERSTLIVRSNGYFGSYGISFAGSKPADFMAVFGFDYSSITIPTTIPPAPRSRPGTTKGLLLTVNKDSVGQIGALNLFPSSGTTVSFQSPDFNVKYDVWMNWTAGNSTEYATVGINHSSYSLTNVPGLAPSDGIIFAMNGDGGASPSAPDFRDFSILGGQGSSPAKLLLPSNTTFGPTPVLGANFDNSDAAITALFPAKTISGFGATPAGAPAMRWVQGEVRYLNNHVTWLLDNKIMAEFDNPTSYHDGDAMIGYFDGSASIGSANNFAIFDNISVSPNPKVLAATSWAVPEKDGVRFYFSVNVEGTPPFTYRWQFYDENYNGWDQGYLEIPIDSASTNSTVSRFFGPFDPLPKSFYINTERYRGALRVGFDGAYGSPPSCPPMCMSLGGAALLSGTAGSATNFVYSTACGSFPAGSRWYRLTTLTKPGIANVTADGTSYNMTYGVFSGVPTSRSSFTAVACTNHVAGLHSQLTFTTTPDLYYWLAVTAPPTGAAIQVASGYDLKISSSTYDKAAKTVEVRSQALPSLQYKLAASTNLTSWDVLLTTNFTSSLNASNILRFVDPNVTTIPQRIYRIEATP
jgi:hypothetical protein